MSDSFVDVSLDKAFSKIAELLSIGDFQIKARRDEGIRGYEVAENGDGIFIKYGDTCDLYRAALDVSLGKKNAVVERKFEKLGYMVDVARNAVPKISTLKRLVTYLAALGYNRLYIYLEDLFEVKGEPFFGYLRGRYSEDELKELDDYCFGFGIELVPCIQTLAHLNAIFKWGEYAKCLDTADIVLVGDDRTYRLISNMFDAVSRVFRTKTVHIGMDEAHLVGRGAYLDQNGYFVGYDVMARHFKKITEIANKYGFDLMMWSDMYFRLAFGGAYYSDNGRLPKNIVDSIPKNVALVYWDYFNRSKKTVSHMISEHKKIGNDVCFAGGAWKWTGWNPSTKLSFSTAKIALKACLENGVDNIMLTAWSDDGAEASLFAALPVMVYYADYGYGETDEKYVDKVLKNVFHVCLSDYYAADMPLIPKEQFKDSALLGKLPKILLYNDPLSGVYDGVIAEYDVAPQAKKYAAKLKRVTNAAPEEFKYIFENLYNLCGVLELKSMLGVNIRKAYKSGDKAELKNIAERTIPLLTRRIKVFEKGFHKQWMNENKDNGYQTHDLRLGGLLKRLKTVKDLLTDYIDGKIDTIYELEDHLLQIRGDEALDMLLWKDWKYIHSAYVV